MFSLDARIQTLVKLGDFFRTQTVDIPNNTKFQSCLEQAKTTNGWFTDQNLQYAFSAWAEALSAKNISQWLHPYSIPKNTKPKTIGLILAGNIPLVGLHDMLCVWVSGHHGLVKSASKDQHILPFIADFLKNECDSDSPKIIFTTEKLQGFDAVIATGSNNAARYFEYYFGKAPHIIRKNRNGLGVLSGNESTAELEALGRDILGYFGLGCRNVSKLLIPNGFDLNRIFGGLYPLAETIHHAKYANNYDYIKALYLMNGITFLENGFFILKEEQAISAPIATAHYEYYTKPETCEAIISKNKEHIQCVVSHMAFPFPTIPFGDAQKPQLWDYADGVDTLEFLFALS